MCTMDLQMTEARSSVEIIIIFFLNETWDNSYVMLEYVLISMQLYKTGMNIQAVSLCMKNTNKQVRSFKSTSCCL